MIQAVNAAKSKFLIAVLSFYGEQQQFVMQMTDDAEARIHHRSTGTAVSKNCRWQL
jgi:hypothetical protein